MKTTPVSLHSDHGISVIQVTHHNKYRITSSGFRTERWASFYFGHKIKSSWQLQRCHESYITITSGFHLLSCKE